MPGSQSFPPADEQAHVGLDLLNLTSYLIYHRAPWHAAVKMRYKKLTNRTILYNITKEETKKSRILLTFSDERGIF